MDLLAGWYPGLGEVEAIRRMSPAVREFVADAAAEYDGFIGDYLLDVLDQYVCPNDKIIHDLGLAIYHLQCQDLRLAGYDDDAIGVGELGGVLKKIKKAVKKVAKKVIEPVKKVAEKITPKPILNLQKKVASAVTSVHKKAEKVAEKVEHAAGQIGKKYGNVIITAAGAVLAPFTAGASLAAAAALTAANTAYQKKRAAAQAKKLAKADAAQLQQDADAANAETIRQVDDFYRSNTQWFIDNMGITPDKWASMTLEQKIAAINKGATGNTGYVPPPVQQPVDPVAPVQPGGGYSIPPSGGGSPAPMPSGGGGGGGGGSDPGAYYPPSPGQSDSKGVQKAGMFSGDMLPLLAAGAALALIFGKPEKSKARRNPVRHKRRRMRACA